MALINCYECDKQISDKAASCPNCGAPVSNDSQHAAGASKKHPPSEPVPVQYEPANDRFVGSMISVVKLAMRAVQSLGWTLEQVNQELGLVTFQTGMSLGSWSGITGSLNIEEVGAGEFNVTGTGKQNLRGGQLIALNIGGEAQGKARYAIEEMKRLAGYRKQQQRQQVATKVDPAQLLKLCEKLADQGLTYEQYQVLAGGADASLGLRTGLVSTRYVVKYQGNSVEFKRLKGLRPWFLANIVPAIRRKA